MSKHTSGHTRQYAPYDPGNGLDTPQLSSEACSPATQLERHRDNDHFGLIYETQEEQFATVIPYIREGLENSERCMYIADDNSRDEVITALREGGVDVDAALASGQLSCHTVEETYLEGGEFDVEAARTLLQTAMEEALTEFEGFRVTAEETWLVGDKATQEAFMTCEAHVNDLLDSEAGMALCQYNRTELPPEVIEDVLKTHPYLIYDDTVCENFYYEPPAEYFGPDQPSRELDRKLATLVDRTNARATIEIRERYQQDLYETIADSQTSFGDKIENLLELGCQRLGLEIGYFTKTLGDDTFEIVEAVGGHESIKPGLTDSLCDTYCEKLLASPGPISVRDAAEVGWTDDPAYERFGLDAYFATTVHVGGEEYGTLCFASETPRKEPYTDAERTFLDLMGQWVEYELERQQRERFLRSCYQITADSARSFEDKLDALIDLGCEQFGFEHGGLARIDPDIDLFEVEKINGGHNYLVPGEQYPLSETYCQLVTENGETAVSNPVSAGFEGKLCYQRFGVEAYLGTHLSVDGDTDRTFWFISNEPLDTPITDTEQAFLDLMGQWVQYELERRQREQALRESEEQLRALIDVLPVAVFVAEADGEIVEWNDAAEDIWGGEVFESGSVAEYDAYDGWWTDTGDPVEPHEWPLARALNGEEVIDPDEIEIEGFDGECRTVLNHGMPVRDADGDVSRAVVTLVDITEQKEREAELRQTKDRFETVFEDSEEGIFILDPDADEIVDANPAAAEMTGYTRDELVSLRPSDIHPDELEEFHAVLAEARETGSAWSEDLHCRHKDGHDISAEITASQITLDGRDLVLTLVRHIGERKKHERYQRDLYEITADPDLGFDEKVERLLELGCDRFGLEMGGLNHLSSWDGEFRLEQGVGLGLDSDEELWTDPDNDCYCRRSITEDEPVAMADVRGTDWTEDTIYQEFGMTSYLGTRVMSGSTPYGTLWFGSTKPRDKSFTAAERSFIELMGQWAGYEIERRENTESQRKLYEITANTDLSIDEKIDRLLEVGCDRLGLPVGMLTCERAEAFEIEHMHGTHPDLDEATLTPPLTDNYCRRVVDTGDSISVADAGAAGWDGDALYHEFDLQCYAGTQVIVDGNPYGTVCFTDTVPREEFTEAEETFLDILGQCIGYEFERQQYEQELEETIDRLQQSNERLEQFAYAASHDLQEPLRMVTSYLQMIEQRYSDAFDEDGEEFLEFAIDGSERMRDMIDALLHYSRIDRRGDPLKPAELDNVLDDVIADLQIEIDETNAEITAEQLPCVECDDSQLRQVFQNLLDNAITYSGDEPPQIHIDAERQGREWVISVHDNGIGISPDEQDKIFTIFDRLHSRDEYEGTGIGLALCQRIVERHDGEIWVEAEPGEGSTFSFTLPASRE